MPLGGHRKPMFCISRYLPAATGHFLWGRYNVGNFSGIRGPQSIAPFPLKPCCSQLGGTGATAVVIGGKVKSPDCTTQFLTSVRRSKQNKPWVLGFFFLLLLFIFVLFTREPRNLYFPSRCPLAEKPLWRAPMPPSRYCFCLMGGWVGTGS